MSDLSEFGVQSSQLDEWEGFFHDGGVYGAQLDADGVRRRHRTNTIVLVVCGIVSAVALVALLVLAVLDFGRTLTYILLGLLAIGAAAVVVKFFLSRRRLRVGLAGASDFLVVSIDGIRVADALDLPWSAITGGAGIDGRGTAGKRLAMRVSRAAGIAEAEMTLGLRDTRALRDAAPEHVRGLFEVMGEYGGIRLPLDTMLSPDMVRPSLVALAVAGRMAGVQVDLPVDKGVAFRRVVEVLNPELVSRPADEEEKHA